MGFALVNGLIYEITRKFRGRDEELPEEESFTALWGIPRASLVLAGLTALSFALFAVLSERAVALPWPNLIPAGLALVLTWWGIARFNKEPRRRQRKMIEGASALYVLAAYSASIVFVQFGV
jgi:hypothetical protein